MPDASSREETDERTVAVSTSRARRRTRRTRARATTGRVRRSRSIFARTRRACARRGSPRARETTRRRRGDEDDEDEDERDARRHDDDGGVVDVEISTRATTYVDGGELAQIYNCVVHPSPAAATRPCWAGFDFVGQRRREEGFDRRRSASDESRPGVRLGVRARARGFAQRPGKVADAAAAPARRRRRRNFTETPTFFADTFARPERADEETMTRSLDVVRAYVDAWTARLDEAEREAEAMDGAVRARARGRAQVRVDGGGGTYAQDAHDAWQLAHDPAIPMFAKWYA